MTWTPGETEQSLPSDEKAAPVDSSGTSIFTALQDQLGLKLESKKVPARSARDRRHRKTLGELNVRTIALLLTLAAALQLSKPPVFDVAVIKPADPTVGTPTACCAQIAVSANRRT